MTVGSAQVVVGTTPTLLASCPASAGNGQQGVAMLFADAAAEVFIGGLKVKTTNGLTLTHALTAPFVVPLFAGDALYGIVATGTATVGVLQTGAA